MGGCWGPGDSPLGPPDQAPSPSGMKIVMAFLPYIEGQQSHIVPIRIIVIVKKMVKKIIDGRKSFYITMGTTQILQLS